MPPLEDDDDSHDDLFGRSAGDDEDELDEADIPADDLPSLQCTRCKKWILEESERCPYCGEYQLADERYRKTRWFIIITIVCILLAIVYLFFHTHEIHRLHL